jgi:predicted deacylase
VLGVLDAPTPDGPDPTLLRGTADHTRAEESGLFELAPDLAVGDVVETGATLGTVYCPATFEVRQSVTATEGGLAYSLKRGGLVMAGERLAGVATPL